MVEIFLHIGIQRTGSTFLQKEIFPNLSINFLRPPEINAFYCFKNIEKFNKKRIRKKIDPYLYKNKKNLISDENIWWHQDFPRDTKYIKLRKLKKVFPNAKIIFGIRNKKDLLLSWYKKFIVMGGTLSFLEYQKNYVCLKDFNIKSYIKKLLNLYKEKNVLIYHFKNLKKNPKNFVEKITNFIGVTSTEFSNRKHNKGYTLWQLKLSRFLNQLWKTNANPEGFIPISYKFIPYRFLFQSPFFPKFLMGKKPTIKNMGGLLEETK